ncbi:hypothetical protein PHYBLDRAFT_59800 [Phycomyces blakesleeanus NRRL 1555(-)]|uniref:Uncharacterized protein n=1 Tax=Phycomyces blakesleeanus (strain ATCC 8743b / DSM 1359 / FGSC 10004 / NBRC 33097 / NRRL 1555) TaxID=763407 RepID=A0A162Q168_PHYB8|nr:hypothetical protein PHYBLDRAFT_59800 [Phycomyces blakesleeanus NRRL 1555(-)]OAD76266.1 hypothetical protein PHYBLDRAFT_59800 [Phycomyces blakesleeanus NRRL 1555(-)]|eukprot:XP_018294306.1 hypothetical protein PHYBLDRAFT_59800 [Phycomyces blakesleeanus NRRL 1555(-)]
MDGGQKFYHYHYIERVFFLLRALFSDISNAAYKNKLRARYSDNKQARAQIFQKIITILRLSLYRISLYQALTTLEALKILDTLRTIKIIRAITVMRVMRGMSSVRGITVIRDVVFQLHIALTQFTWQYNIIILTIFKILSTILVVFQKYFETVEVFGIVYGLVSQ